MPAITLKRKTVREIAAVAISAVVAGMAALCWPPEHNIPRLDPALRPIQQIEWWGYDSLFRWRGPTPEKIDPRIAVVGYSFNTEGRGQLDPDAEVVWPPPRHYHAKVIDNLVRDGAKVIVFDVLFHQPTKEHPEEDRALDKSLLKAGPGTCILASRIDRDEKVRREETVAPYYDDSLGINFERDGGATEAYADIPTESADVLASFQTTTTDSDPIVRRMLPLQKIQGEWLPSLSAAAFLKLTDGKIEDSRETADAIWLGEKEIPRTGPTITDPVNADNVVGTSYMDFPAGLSMFQSGINSFSYEQVYRGEFKPGTFKGRAVFIGVTGLELTTSQIDKFRTAYSNFTPEQVGGEVTRSVYGVFVQAQTLNALLQDGFIRQAQPLQIFFLVFLVSSLGTAAIRGSMSWRGPLLLFVSVGSYIALSYLLFTRGHTYLPWVVPSTLLLGSAAGVAWFERGQMRRMWSGYVSPAYLEVMMREGIETKPQRFEEATVIFGDIRGFTKFSEKHDPETVVRLLDKHLEKLVAIVFSEHGTVDKFLGDGILIVFGPPLKTTGDDAVRAVRAVWKMSQAAALPVLDEDGSSYNFDTGFGITTGPLVCGHIGSKKLSSFTLIGDTVNLASRLQAITGMPDIIIDGPTLEKVEKHVVVQSLGARSVKGKEQAVDCYKVLDWHDDPRPFEGAIPPEELTAN